MAEKGYIQYFDAIDALEKKIRDTQGENIEKAAAIVAEALVNDHLLHVYGAVIPPASPRRSFSEPEQWRASTRSWTFHWQVP
jgi:hypothetical protein